MCTPRFLAFYHVRFTRSYRSPGTGGRFVGSFGHLACKDETLVGCLLVADGDDWRDRSYADRPRIPPISRQILARRPPCARRLASVTRGGGVPPTRTVVAQIGEKRLAHILTVDRWSTLTSLHKVPHVALKFPTSLRAGGLLSPSDTWLVGRACVRRGFLILGDKSWSDTRDSESGIQSWLAAKLSRSSETSGPARNAV